MCTFRPRFLDHQTTEAQHHVTLGLAELGQPLDGKALHDAIARGKTPTPSASSPTPGCPSGTASSTTPPRTQPQGPSGKV